MVFITTTTTDPNAPTVNAAPPAAVPSVALPTVATTPTATTTATTTTTTTPVSTDIVSLAEKLQICHFYANLNNEPSTASFNTLYNRLRLDAVHTPTASPVTPLSPPTTPPATPPTTPPCTPANPPPGWQPSARSADAQIAAALRDVCFNGVKPTSVAHLLQLRALQTTSLQQAELSANEQQQLDDQYQQQYIVALHNARTKLREALRSRIRDAIKLRCIKPAALRKPTAKSTASKSVKTSSSSSSSPPTTSKSQKALAKAAAAAAAAAAARASNNASDTIPTVVASVPSSVSSVPSDLSLEQRVHRLFRAHRFMLRESEKVLAHMRVAYESNMSPIMSDDDMDDERNATDALATGGGATGGANGGAANNNRAMLNVAN